MIATRSCRRRSRAPSNYVLLPSPGAERLVRVLQCRADELFERRRSWPSSQNENRTGRNARASRKPTRLAMDQRMRRERERFVVEIWSSTFSEIDLTVEGDLLAHPREGGQPVHFVRHVKTSGLVEIHVRDHELLSGHQIQAAPRRFGHLVVVFEPRRSRSSRGDTARRHPRGRPGASDPDRVAPVGALGCRVRAAPFAFLT